MKLYTEEKLRNSMLSMKTYINVYDESVIDRIIENHIKALKEAELPSDEDIREERLLQFPDSEYANRANDRLAFYCGARFVINKIQGGNND